jgi:hypothetical protein
MRETILGQIGAKLARQDIEATARWVESMKDDKASFRIMDNLLTQWVPKDPARASQWVSESKRPRNASMAFNNLPQDGL